MDIYFEPCKILYGDLYSKIARHVPYAVLCDWEDKLKNGDVPEELLELIILSRSYSHHVGRSEHR